MSDILGPLPYLPIRVCGTEQGVVLRVEPGTGYTMLPFSVLIGYLFGPKAILKLWLKKVVKVGDDLIMLYEPQKCSGTNVITRYDS